MDNFYDTDTQSVPVYDKSALKRTLIGIIIMLLFTYIVGFSCLYISEIPYILFGLEYGDSYIFDTIINTGEYTVRLVIPMLFYMLLSKTSIFSIIKVGDGKAEGDTVRPLTVLLYFLSAFALSCAMSYVTSLISFCAGLDSSVFDTPTATNPAELLFDIISIAIFPAIIEELVFRGLFLRALIPYGRDFAIVTAALLFATVHGSVEQIMYSLVYGVIFSVIAIKCGSIIPGMVIHFLNNSISCLFNYLVTVCDGPAIQLALGILTVVLVSLGLIFTVYLIGRGDYSLPKECETKSAISTSEAFSVYLTPIPILYGLLIVAETVLSYIL